MAELASKYTSGDFDYHMKVKDAARDSLFSNGVWMTGVSDAAKGRPLLEVWLGDPSKRTTVEAILRSYDALNFKVIISSKKTFIPW